MKMKWSIYLGKIAGIKIFVHWTFLILVFWVVHMHLRAGDSRTEVLTGVALLFALFGCVLLHELGHALMARRFRIGTRYITMLPIGGVAMLEGLPEKPAQELAVAIAGPLVNLVLAALLFLLMQLTGSWPANTGTLRFSGTAFWFNLFSANIFLALFNLIPAFPMDGGRVLRALLSFRWNRVKATRVAASLGQVLAIGFVIAGFYLNPMLIFIGFFIFLGAQAELGAERIKSAFSGISAGDVLMRNYTCLQAGDTLAQAAARILNGQEKAFLVKDGQELVGTLSWKELVSGLSQHHPNTTVASVMNTKPTRIDANMPLQDTIEIMKNANDALFPVYAGNELVGVINMENVTEFIALQHAVRKDDRP